MKKNKILHIYAGTSGAAGSYIHTIYNALSKSYDQDVIVSKYYPYNYGKKIFYTFTELSGKNYFSKFPKLRLYMRFLELCYGLFYSLIFIAIKKPSIVNYSMNNNLKIELLFLKIIKNILKRKLIITCHDVIPFDFHFRKNKKNSYQNDIKERKRFFNLADYLLVHNESSRKQLKQTFKVCNSKIIHHDFPVMDLQYLYKKQKTIHNQNLIKVLFIGHMRKEKGIDLLIDAWNKENCENILLTIAGNIPMNSKLNFSVNKKNNFHLIDGFVDDKSFVSLIGSSDFVIFPYKKGTNSGIPSSVASLGAIPVASNIPMFKENILIGRDWLFEANDVNSLRKMLNKINQITVDEKESALLEVKHSYYNYKSRVDIDILESYKYVINEL